MAEQAVVLFSPPKEPTKIGAIECDVLVELETTLASEVTEHPVEDGFPVHDHVIRKPVKLSMVVVISNSPVTWYDRFGGPSPERMSDALVKFEEIYKTGQPITIVTSEKIYENMVMTDAKFRKSKENGRVLRVPLELTQIRKVQVRQVDIPPEYVHALTKGKAGETGKDAGTAAQTDIGTGGDGTNSSNNTTASKSKSILKGFLGG